MATFEKTINRFDGGISNNPRDKSVGTSRVVTNFDVLTEPTKLVPYRSSESGDNAASTSKKSNFTVALRTGSTHRLYALGVVSGTTRAEVLMKDLTTSSNDLADDTWLTPANNSSSTGTASMELFVYYKATGLIYGARAGTQIWSFDPTSVSAWVDSAQALTYTDIYQGIVHSKDDVLYVPYYNSAGGAGAKSYIATFDGSSWNNTALNLPDSLKPVAICEYNSFLAIACAPVSGVGKSVVYLWDRDSSVNTLSENYDWGEGNIKIIEEVDGVLIGISLLGGSTTTIKDRVIFRYLSGYKAEKFKEITGTSSTLLPYGRQKINNRLYFMMSINLNGSIREGVWSLGRSSPTAPFALSHDRTPNNDTALTNGVLNNFYIVGDFMFISYQTSGAYALSKTVEPESFSHNAIYESVKFDGDDPSKTKKLIGVTVFYEPVDGGTITLKYRTETETSYTTIFTHTCVTTTNHHSAINIESTGANLPEFKEIEFQIIVRGEVEIFGYTFKGEYTGKRLYE